MGRKQSRQGKHIYLFIACAILIGLGITGCSSVQGLLARSDYWQADQYLADGNDSAALAQYRQITGLYPQASDEALFGIGCILANPKNPEKNYQKSLDALGQLVSEYPRSKYRVSAETLIALIGEVMTRDKVAPTLRKQVESSDKQVESLQKQVESLQQQIEQMKEIDRSLEEKRRAIPPRK
ncbi:MAG TPA: tetratricopeptide repeat protein [Syntrophales bacterium]